MKRNELKLILRRGTVLYKNIRGLTSSEPHYLIILNNPKEHNGAVVSVVTSQIEKRRERILFFGLHESSLVILPKFCYQHFSKDSAVDCNVVGIIPFDDLLTYTPQDFKSPDFPHEYINQIIQRVLESPKVQPSIKKILSA